LNFKEPDLFTLQDCQNFNASYTKETVLPFVYITVYGCLEKVMTMKEKIFPNIYLHFVYLSFFREISSMKFYMKNQQTLFGREGWTTSDAMY